MDPANAANWISLNRNYDFSPIIIHAAAQYKKGSHKEDEIRYSIHNFIADDAWIGRKTLIIMQ